MDMFGTMALVECGGMVGGAPWVERRGWSAVGGAPWVERWLEHCARSLGNFFTPLFSSSFRCINEYLAIDGWICEQIAVIAVRLNSSQRWQWNEQVCQEVKSQGLDTVLYKNVHFCLYTPDLKILCKSIQNIKMAKHGITG